jgi:hypothetical protein
MKLYFYGSFVEEREVQQYQGRILLEKALTFHVEYIEG